VSESRPYFTAAQLEAQVIASNLLPFSPWWSLPLVPALRVLGARLVARAMHKATGLLLCSLPQALYESLGVFACDLFREG